MELLDKYMDYWDWYDLINNEGVAHLFSIDFVIRYQRYIPWDELNGSLLAEKVRKEFCGGEGRNIVDCL